jgi:3-hydroxyisobutyrate dehydrogenase
MASPFLEKMGKVIFYLEQPTPAAKMKLINNLALRTFMAIMAEITTFGSAVGRDKAKALDTLAVGGETPEFSTPKKSNLTRMIFLHSSSLR